MTDENHGIKDILLNGKPYEVRVRNFHKDGMDGPLDANLSEQVSAFRRNMEALLFSSPDCSASELAKYEAYLKSWSCKLDRLRSWFRWRVTERFISSWKGFMLNTHEEDEE